MFTPWNSFSACLLAKNDCISEDRLNLVNHGHVNPLGLEVHHQSGGFAPWNFGSACLAARSGCIGEDRLNLLNRSDVIPLGFTPWNAVFPVKHPSLGILAIASGQNLCHRGISLPLGFSHSLARYAIKLHQLTMRVELFCFAHGIFCVIEFCYSNGEKVATPAL